MNNRNESALAAACALCLTVTSAADVVRTSDGSRIVGKIQRMYGGKLVIETEIAGTLEIDAAKVVAVSTDEAINVQLDSGDRLVGKADMTPGEDGIIVHSGVGDLDVSAERVTSLWPRDADSPEVVALRAEVEEIRKALTPVWTVTLQAGANMREGNTETLNARGRFDVKRKTPQDLLEFYIAATYGEQNDVRTDNEYVGGIRYEEATSDRAYWYTRMGAEFDEFEDLDLRFVTTVGGGRYWIKKPQHELKTSLGLGYRHESFDTGRTTDAAVIDLGLNYRVDIAPWMQFTHQTMYSPDIEELDDYRFNIDTAVLLPFENPLWKLKVGMRNEYSSRPQRGLERLDNTYYADVVLSLK